MPITTVRKITGPVTVLMSWMKASASHFAFLAWSGATRPKTIPAAIATRTQTHSWPTRRRRGRVPSGASAAGADIEAPPVKLAPPPRRGGAPRTHLPPWRGFAAWFALQPSPGDRDCVRACVDEDEPAPELGGDRAERAGPGEEVQAPAAGPGRGGDHARDDALGLLRRVAGALGAVRRDDRVPPRVGRALAAGALLRRDEARGHVRLPVDLGVVEVVLRRVADVDEDRVVLRRPAPPRAPAVVVGPHDLVEEAGPAEQPVERDLDVVRLARVEVDVERAVRGEEAPRLGELGHEERGVVVEGVVELQGALRFGLVAPAGEPDPVAALVGDDAQALAPLRVPRVEGRVDVDHVEGAAGQARQDVGAVALDQEVVVFERDRVGGVEHPHGVGA